MIEDLIACHGVPVRYSPDDDCYTVDALAWLRLRLAEEGKPQASWAEDDLAQWVDEGPLSVICLFWKQELESWLEATNWAVRHRPPQRAGEGEEFVRRGIAYLRAGLELLREEGPPANLDALTQEIRALAFTLTALRPQAQPRPSSQQREQHVPLIHDSLAEILSDLE